MKATSLQPFFVEGQLRGSFSYIEHKVVRHWVKKMNQNQMYNENMGFNENFAKFK